MKIETLDKSIVNCLKKGLYEDALLGKEECFVYGSYYRGDHDVLLVVSTMMRWANEENNLAAVSGKFVDALSTIIREDLIKGFRILNCYFIMYDDTGIDFEIDYEALLPDAEIGANNLGGLSADEYHMFSSLMKAINKETDAFKSIKY